MIHGDDKVVKEVILNDVALEVSGYKEQLIQDQGGDKERKSIIIDFKVNSNDYHTITTLLYKNLFHVKVPEMELEFMGTISEYSTSITNLYNENEVGDFHLGITEVAVNH